MGLLLVLHHEPLVKLKVLALHLLVAKQLLFHPFEHHTWLHWLLEFLLVVAIDELSGGPTITSLGGSSDLYVLTIIIEVRLIANDIGLLHLLVL